MLKNLLKFLDRDPAAHVSGNVLDIPDDVLKALEELTRFTPDLAYLQRQESHLVFVYNELMRGGWKNNLMLLPGHEKSVMLGPAVTENTYTVFQKRMGSEPFPIAIKTKMGAPSLDFGEVGAFTVGLPAQIGGQLFGIYPEMFPAIDKHMLNGIYFRRKRLTVLVPSRLKEPVELASGRIMAAGDWKITPVRAWAYEGRPEFWDKHLAPFAFTPVALRRKTPATAHRGPFQVTDKFYYFDPTIFKAEAERAALS